MIRRACAWRTLSTRRQTLSSPIAVSHLHKDPHIPIHHTAPETIRLTRKIKVLGASIVVAKTGRVTLTNLDRRAQDLRS